MRACAYVHVRNAVVSTCTYQERGRTRASGHKFKCAVCVCARAKSIATHTLETRHRIWIDRYDLQKGWTHQNEPDLFLS